MAEIQSQKFVEDIRQFNCPNCGNQLTIINKRTKYVGCNYCGAVSDPNSEVSRIILKLNSPSKYPPFSFLKLGLKAVIDGFEYKIIGRTRWQTTHMEYWKESSYEGYGTEKWVYDEWLLMGERFDYFYVVEDAEGFYVSKNIVPQHPSLPTNAPKLSMGIDPKPVQNQPLSEVGSAKVVFFEGETTYQIKPGDAIHYASYEKNKISYVIEWRTDEDNPQNQYEIKEIEFFEERKIPIQELKKWFARDEQTTQRIFLLFDRYLWTKKVLGWASAVCLILAIVDYQPDVLRVEKGIKRELISEKEEKTELLENLVFDSVYVQEVNGEKTYPLTEDLLDKNSEYSELKNPNLEFAILSKDTTVLNTYSIAYATYKVELLKYPIKIQANKNYYFGFNASRISILIVDKDHNIIDEVKEAGWKKWSSDVEGFVVLQPLRAFFNNVELIIQRELYSSFGMLIASFVFASLWILYLPISEWVFSFKSEKR